MPEDAGGITYALGFILATALLHFAGIAAAVSVIRQWASMVGQLPGLPGLHLPPADLAWSWDGFSYGMFCERS